jgi:hypothetical protein
VDGVRFACIFSALVVVVPLVVYILSRVATRGVMKSIHESRKERRG